MGFSAPEFSLLLNRLGKEYLERLYHYVADKKKRHLIKAEKPYLYGVAKKMPDIDSLLTPDIINRNRAEKTAALEESLRLAEQEQSQAAQKASNAAITQAEDYIAGLTPEVLLQLQEEFDQSIQAR